MNITEFLLARIAEDELLATAAIETEAPDRWENPTETLNQWPANIAFWGSQTPYRVLAECAAKRAIIEEHSPVDYSRIGMKSPNACNLCGVEKTMADWEWDENSFPCKTLRAIAAIYAGHPDYQQEWAL